MSTLGSGGGGSGGAAGAGRAAPSQLAALHYESLAQAAASTGSSLWTQLKDKFPEIRNATHYYANEAQRYGATLMEEAQKRQQQLGLGTSPVGENGGTDHVTNTTSGGNEQPVTQSGSNDEGSPLPEGATGAMTEVHYQPNPIGQLGLTVRSTDVATLPGTGETVLCMCIDQGFACFEVTPTAVFEIVVDLGIAMNPMSRVPRNKRVAPPQGGSSSVAGSTISGTGPTPVPSGGPNSYVIDVQPLSLNTFILLTSTGWLLAVHLGGAASGAAAVAAGGSSVQGSSCNSLDAKSDYSTSTSMDQGSSSSGGTAHLVGFCQVNTTTPKALKLMRGSGAASAVVSSTEFAQLTVYSIRTRVAKGSGALEEVVFQEGPTLLGETTVFATSPNWLAYSGQADAAKTVFVNTKTESNIESMANMAMNSLNKIKTQGLGAMWGTSPSLGPQAPPLGTVVIANMATAPQPSPTGTGENLSFGSNKTGASGQAIGDFASFSAHNHPIQTMKWDSTGTLLATASTVGTSVNVFQVMPCVSTSITASEGKGSSSSGGSGSTATAEVAQVYRLNRGVTQNQIVDISFGGYNSWIAVCSATGTCHFYKIPRTDQMLHGKKAAMTPARNLGALCRARSAPSSTPVCPRFVFTPSVLTIGGSLHGVEGCLVTQSGTVNWITCTEEGATLAYTKSIDAFSGDKEKVVEASMAHFQELQNRDSSAAAGGSRKTSPAIAPLILPPKVSPFISGCGVVADAYFGKQGAAAGSLDDLSGAVETDDGVTSGDDEDAMWRAQIELSTHDAAAMEWNVATPLLPNTTRTAKPTDSSTTKPVKGTHVDPQPQGEDDWDDC